MNILRRGTSIGALLLVFGAAGCATPAPPPPPVMAQPAPPPPPPPPAPVTDAVTVGDDASGTTVKLHSGQMLTVSLSGESGSTGYAWKIIAGTGPHLVKTGRMVDASTPGAAPGQPGMIGGPKTVRFGFEAKHPGVTFLRIGLFNPGRHHHVTKTFKLKVVVAKG